LPVNKGGGFMKSRFSGGVCAFLMVLVSSGASASPAKFNIPGDFPGDFQIDFLGTDFKLAGTPTGALSTASTIQFSVGSETSAGSGIYNITIAPQGFNFLGFQPVSGLPFDVYGAGTGSGTFDTTTGHWSVDMPALFVQVGDDGFGGSVGDGTRVDFHLTTSNIFIPGDGFVPGYMTSFASPMVLDESSPDPWGDLYLVAGGLVPNSAALTLAYDTDLINSIAGSYSAWSLDENHFQGIQYEFDIYGNDPLVSTVPVPGAFWLFGSGLLGLIEISRCRKVA
jgi:hypothetical protein